MSCAAIIVSSITALSLIAFYALSVKKVTFPLLIAGGFTAVAVVFIFMCQQLKNGCLAECQSLVFVPLAMFLGTVLIFTEVWLYD